MGLGWMIKPFVTSIPRESLLMTLGSTRKAAGARLHPLPPTHESHSRSKDLRGSRT